MPFIRPEIIRPPSEHRSYYLPLTGGCSNNTCSFCGYYGSRLQVRDLTEVKQEVDALSLFMEHGVRLPDLPEIIYYIAQQWDGRRIFLQDGDALAYPYPHLKEALQYLKEKTPALERIASYATPKDILRRSLAELKELRELKLKILYMGIESGDDEILERVQKGANSQEIIEAGRRVKEADITLSVTVILGLGGVEQSEQHTLATARILTEIDPDYVGALTLTLVPGTPLYDQWQQGKFTPIDPFRSLEELRVILDNSSYTNCFFGSMHASNYVSIRGKIPPDKPKMLKQLENVLRKRDATLLKPEFLRGL